MDFPRRMLDKSHESNRISRRVGFCWPRLSGRRGKFKLKICEKG